MSDTVVLRVRNIQCEGCADRVRRTLDELEGVEAVYDIDVADGAVELELDEDLISRDTLRAAFDRAGFPLHDPGPRAHAAAGDGGDASGDTTDAATGGAADPAQRRPGGRVAVRFGALALVVLLVGLLGYGVYELYPRFDMPAVDGLALLALAAGAGVASFFSPCAFSLLLTIVGREAALDEDDEAQHGRTAVGLTRPLRFATAVSLGAATFVVLLGAVIAFGGRTLVGQVVFTSTEGRILRAAVGLFLAAMGLIQAGFLPNPLHGVAEALGPLSRLRAEQLRKRPFVGSALFGFGYLLAGFG